MHQRHERFDLKAVVPINQIPPEVIPFFEEVAQSFIAHFLDVERMHVVIRTYDVFELITLFESQ